MSEAWRKVPGFPLYEVSDQGRVRSLRFGKVRLLRPGFNHFGYGSVHLWREGAKSSTSCTVHTLVASAFIGPRPEGQHVRHLDGNPRNNTSGNLSYGTVRENALDTVRHGRNRAAAKTHCPSGHEYTPENTYTPPSRPGWRYCRTCSAERSRARRKVAA